MNVDSEDQNQNALSLRQDFPYGFMFGTATSAFQIEGAVADDGRGPSIWDTLCQQRGYSGWEKTSNHYYMYEEDVKLMKEMGLDSYRFSISWARVLPMGTRGENDEYVNQKGVEFYSKLIDLLKDNEIEPLVTLFHFDTPQALESLYGGFLCDPNPDGGLPQIAVDFGEYADLCFETFGKKVKHWITLNEPYSFSFYGYGLGAHAPGRCTPNYPTKMALRAVAKTRYFSGLEASVSSNEYKRLAQSGNSGTEPYIVAHNLLLSHAKAYDVYKKKYKSTQNGQIGMSNMVCWPIPKSDSPMDQNAAYRAMDFMFGWFMEPLHNGDYPQCMKELVKERLPEFTEQQKKLLKGSYDFLGLNYYTSNYVEHEPATGSEPKHVATDPQIAQSTELNGVPIGSQAGSSWLFVYPKGFLEILLYIKRRYNDPDIFITENGINEKTAFVAPLWESLLDHHRLEYLHYHIGCVRKAIYEYGVKVKGYLVWSLMDNFEWAEVFTVRFGTIHVDYENGFKRSKKLSAEWLKLALQGAPEKIPVQDAKNGGLKPRVAAQAETTPLGREKKRARG